MAPSPLPDSEVTPAEQSPAEQEDQYNSEEDSDFDINAPGEEEDAASDVEDKGRPSKRRKTSTEGPVEEDEDFGVDGALDSGDEATIQKGKDRREKAKKKQKKGKKKGEDQDEEEEDDFDFEDDEGGEGGFVRTRGMRMRMEEERRPLANASAATVDVDALWAAMNAPGAGLNNKITSAKESEPVSAQADTPMADGENSQKQDQQAPRPGEETITIKRTYKFAGEIITEEKVVPKDSAEAKLYLSSIEAKKAAKSTEENEKDANVQLRRPLRRYSRFDPNPPELIKRSWEKLRGPASAGEEPKGPKLNTVMKSRLDWAAYVDQEGIKDELDVHSRAKEGYLGRMDFLDRVDQKREEERRNARLKTAV